MEGLDPEEARVMLSDIYNWFTQGIVTPGLREATALLDEFNAVLPKEA